jgi:hypothetical protein
MDASPKTTFSARRGSIFAFLGLAPLSGLLTLVSALDIPPQISPRCGERRGARGDERGQWEVAGSVFHPTIR